MAESGKTPLSSTPFWAAFKKKNPDTFASDALAFAAKNGVIVSHWRTGITDADAKKLLAAVG